MKRFLTFIIRLSIINFIFIFLAVVFIAKYNEGVVKVETTQTVNSGSSAQVTGDNSSSTPSPKVTNLFSELQNHNRMSDCWISYSGHIYNMTSYIGFHPGGDDYIIRYCGKDATEIFNRNHSEDSRVLLQQYLVK